MPSRKTAGMPCGKPCWETTHAAQPNLAASQDDPHQPTESVLGRWPAMISGIIAPLLPLILQAYIRLRIGTGTLS